MFDRPTGYAIQAEMAGLLDLGRRIGWKLGMTALASTGEPMAGPIHEAMVIPSGGRIDIGGTIGAELEVEIAVILGADIDAPMDRADLLGTPFLVAPAFEIIDRRTSGEPTAADLVADMATMRYVVIGEPRRFGGDALADLAGRLEDGTTEVASGRCGDVLADPFESIGWLSRHLDGSGTMPRRGDVIITGSMTGQHTAEAGHHYTGRIDGMKPVNVVFHEGAGSDAADPSTPDPEAP